MRLASAITRLISGRRLVLINLAVIGIFILAWNQSYHWQPTTRSELIHTLPSLTTDAPCRCDPKLDTSHTTKEDYRARFKYDWDVFNPNVGLDSIGDPRKYMIYRCGPGMMGCGGWADRVKGMLVGYMMANLTERVFKIDFHNPSCDITKALFPNKVDWRLPQPFHENVGLKKIPQNTAVLKITDELKAIETMNFSQSFDQRVQYVYMSAHVDYMYYFKKTKVYPERLAWMRDLRKDQIFSEIYRRLFRLSPEFQNRMDVFLQEHVPTPQHKLICAHIRMGMNPTIPDAREPIRMRSKFLPTVWKFISKHSLNDQHKVFIMSDSIDTIEDAGKQPFSHRMISTPGAILHIAKSRGNETDSRCKALEKVIFDQAILMNCDVLIISKSGLSRMAAFVRGSDKDLYCLLTSGKIVTCKSNQFSTLYKTKG